jgi:hypothetical protein
MTEQMMFLKDGSAEEAPTAVPDRGLSFDDDPNDFRIDPQARAIGRVGIAAARQALAEAIARAAAREQRLAA